MNDPLADLRDIHLPEPVSWWPLAPGWWLLAALIVLLMVSLWLFYSLWWKKRRYRRLAKTELETIMAQYQQGQCSAIQLLDELSELVRRTALASGKYRADIAQLSGSEWQAWLQQSMPEPEARMIAVARYQKLKDSDIDTQRLEKAIADWIREHSHD